MSDALEDILASAALGGTVPEVKSRSPTPIHIRNGETRQLEMAL
jgi:hypothetical protein